MELEHFDEGVKHDVDSGMIDMIKQAYKTVARRGLKLSLFASPWSPPAWMKLPVNGNRSMIASAKPNGLDPRMQRPWAKYFSKFIAAYKRHGIDMWAVTVQNEPEAAVGWEACLWNASFQASFVKNHLGPVLREEQPGVKIIGFDHNKDHVYAWAKALYADKEAAEFFDGIAVHWYGGLNTHNLNATHHLAPGKFILPSEACNCGGVVFRTPDVDNWWSRAESLALDILEDLRFWAIGWTDWNLILSTGGGPNHLKNLCDANIIADPEQSEGLGRIIMQASYYFVGHFSRFIPQGSRRIWLHNSVQSKLPPVSAGDVMNGQPLVFKPCDDLGVQQWSLDSSHSLVVPGSNVAPTSDGFEHGGMCVDLDTNANPPKLQVWACSHLPNQMFSSRTVPGGHELYHVGSGKCITKVAASGAAVGLDAGTSVEIPQLGECGSKASVFTLANYDGGGFPSNFATRTHNGLCLQPLVTRKTEFDAVAFQAPDGSISLVALNTGEKPIEFALHDAQAGIGVPSITLPPHAIHSYRWKPDAAQAWLDRSAAEGDNDALLTDRLQTTLTTPAEHADAQALLRAARLQTAPPQMPAAQAAVQSELQTRLDALQLLSQQALPARASAATPDVAAPADTAPGRRGLGVAALWVMQLGLLVPLIVAVATTLRRRRWQPLPTEASGASAWPVADYLPPAAVEAPEEGAAYLEFAPTR